MILAHNEPDSESPVKETLWGFFIFTFEVNYLLAL
jgi:hypothetical protein